MPEMRRPARVLLTTDAVGGVWTHSLELASGLAAKGIEVVLAVMGPRASVDQVRAAKTNPLLTLLATELPLDWLAANERDLDDAARIVSGLANRHEADLVHLHAPGLAGRRPWSLPLVVTAHSCVGTWWSAVRTGRLPPDLAWRARRTAAGIDIANAVIAPSRSFADAMMACYQSDTPVTPVLNGRRPLRESRKVPLAQRNGIVTAGRLWDAAKDIATLDRAAERLACPIEAAGPVRGPGGEVESPQHLSLLGVLDPIAMAHKLSTTAVFVSTSVYEPFGLAVLEAAQAGNALVLSDIPTFRELWGHAALFVKPKRPMFLADSLRRLLDEPELRVRLAQLAGDRARRFTTARMVSGTLSVYAEVLGHRHPSRPTHRSAWAA